MKRVVIGSIVAAVIYFVFQTFMWVGGVHSDFGNFTPNQDSIIENLNQNLDEDGLYFIPMADPKSPDRMKAEEEMTQKNIGKPWAMIFYHNSMTSGGEASSIIFGVLYALIAAFIVAFTLYHGNFNTFFGRFSVSMAFAVFALCQGILDDINWWNFSWNFVSAQIIDLMVGWLLASIWLAWFVKARNR